MKKLLSLIFISLLLSGNAYAERAKVVLKDSESIIFKVKTGPINEKMLSYQISTAKQHCKSLSKTMYIFGESFGNNYSDVLNLRGLWKRLVYDSEKGGFWSYRSRFICANSLSEAFNIFNTQFGFDTMLTKNGAQIKYSNSDWIESSFKKVNKSSNSTQSNTASSTSSSSSMSMKDKITQAKQICTDLGFQQKTEKHADCSMQMMSIQFETTNKVASASGGTTQEVIVTHRNDYDIWDALLDFSAAIDPKNKTTTSSSSSNRGTNCVVGRTNPTFGTTTINCN